MPQYAAINTMFPGENFLHGQECRIVDDGHIVDFFNASSIELADNRVSNRLGGTLTCPCHFNGGAQRLGNRQRSRTLRVGKVGVARTECKTIRFTNRWAHEDS